jgi:N-acetylglucosaminyl-diphospho-decaprenol L-rhamnosyltransferase
MPLRFGAEFATDYLGLTGDDWIVLLSREHLGNNDVVDITIVIVNYNTGHLLERLFSALGAAQGVLKLQMIVIDNASRDNSVEILCSKYPFVELIENTSNVGFGRANNQAVARARGRYLLLLNPDAFVARDTLIKTFSFMEKNSRTGILGVRLLNEDGSPQPWFRVFPTPWNEFVAANALGRFFPGTGLIEDMAGDHREIRTCDWVRGCFYLVRKEVIDHVGLFDPRFFLYFEEIDHCRRCRQAGWDVTYFGDTEVVHIGGESAKTDASITRMGRQITGLHVESELLYFRKHYGLPGLIFSIVLTACGALLARVKDILKPARSGQRNEESEKLATILSLLFPTKLATRSTR